MQKSISVGGRFGAAGESFRILYGGSVKPDNAAELMGVRPLYAKLSAFAVSSFYCGVAGAMMVFFWLGAAEVESFDISVPMLDQLRQKAIQQGFSGAFFSVTHDGGNKF